MNASMAGRRFAVERWLIALYCWSTAVYAFMSASPFVYRQFLAPRVFRWIGVFSAWHAPIYWVWLALALLHISGAVRRGPARGSAAAFGAVWTSIGVFLVFHPVLPQLVDDRRSLIVGFVALVPIVWLAVIDHIRHADLLKAPHVDTLSGSRADSDQSLSDDGRLFVGAVGTSGFVTIVYAVLTPVATAGQFEPDLLTAGLTAGFLWNLLDHLVIFCGLFLVLATIDRVFLRKRFGLRYRMTVAVCTLITSLMTEQTISDPLGFSGMRSWLVALAFAASLMALWTSLQLNRWLDEPQSPSTPFELLFGPSAGAELSVARLLPFVTLALAMYAVGRISRIVDWDFLLLKSGLFALWTATFGLAFRAASRGVRIGNVAITLTSVIPPVVYVLFSSFPWLAPRHALDRYVVYNPSFRVAEGILREASAADDRFQKFLRDNSGLSGDVDASSVDIDFATFDETQSGPRPFIFLFVIDSLRPDYLQPYNPSVTFTPNVARFGSESLVFRNAFTVFGGTGLSVPAIWSGSIGVHKQYVKPFAPMNALDKLLTANGYRKFLSLDSIIRQLLTPSPSLIELDYGFLNEEFRFCRTLGELETKLDAGAADPRPAFAYTLPQDLHVSNIITARVPFGEAYPGFHAPYAARVHRIDACFGEFIDFLKRRGWYDRSVIVLTADHGEMLGEDGIWGHVYYLFPPVIQVPLMVHVPAALAARAAVDLEAVSLTTDITPTIYTALGAEPRRTTRLMGRPLIGSRGAHASMPRSESYVMAASYSAVYGVLRSNGRRLYIVDAVQHREYAYERRASEHWMAAPVTDELREGSQRMIREHILEINRLYQVRGRD